MQTILEYLATGDSIEEILAAYPNLCRTDIEACLDYASRLLGNRFTLETA